MAVLDENIVKAEGYVKRWRAGGVLNHINGASVEAASGARFDNRSPVDGALPGEAARGGAADVDAAAAAAKETFPAWAALPGAERRALLHRIADAIEARAEEIAFTECMDTGQALKFMGKAALRGAQNFRF